MITVATCPAICCLLTLVVKWVAPVVCTNNASLVSIMTIKGFPVILAELISFSKVCAHLITVALYLLLTLGLYLLLTVPLTNLLTVALNLALTVGLAVALALALCISRLVLTITGLVAQVLAAVDIRLGSRSIGAMDVSRITVII